MLVQYLLAFIVRVLVGARALWIGCKPSDTVRIYFANHTSHMDTIALWCALPSNLRAKTRPVAAADYWHGGFRGWLARHGFNALLIDRSPGNRDRDPLAPLAQALERGESLIIFPEGTRHAQALPGEFKSGIFYLARQAPAAELVPVYLDNLYRSMPKGTFLPVPLTCMVRFGTPLRRESDEAKEVFLARVRQAVIDLA